MIEAQGSRYPGEPIRSYFDSEHEVWRERAAQDPAETGLFVLPLAPDRVLKENVSGGPPYGFVLPDGCADGLFAAETTMPFVSYLTARLAARSQTRAGDRAVCSGVVLAGPVQRCKGVPLTQSSVCVSGGDPQGGLAAPGLPPAVLSGDRCFAGVVRLAGRSAHLAGETRWQVPGSLRRPRLSLVAEPELPSGTLGAHRDLVVHPAAAPPRTTGRVPGRR